MSDERRVNAEHDGQMRVLIAQGMEASYLSSEKDRVVSALTFLEESHEELHEVLTHLEQELGQLTAMPPADADLDELNEMVNLTAKRVRYLHEWHFAVEYLELLTSSHLNRLDEGEATNDSSDFDFPLVGDLWDRAAPADPAETTAEPDPSVKLYNPEDLTPSMLDQAIDTLVRQRMAGLVDPAERGEYIMHLLGVMRDRNETEEPTA